MVCRAPFRVVRGCGMATKVQRRAGRAKVSSSAFALDPPSLHQPKPPSSLSGQARGERERLWGQGTGQRDALGREVKAQWRERGDSMPGCQGFGVGGGPFS